MGMVEPGCKVCLDSIVTEDPPGAAIELFRIQGIEITTVQESRGRDETELAPLVERIGSTKESIQPEEVPS